MKYNKLFCIYKKLYNYFGKQHWWPAKTKLEIIVGAMLTQNTSWSNVEKAIENMRKKDMLSLQKLSKARIKQIANLIRPAGYFNVKAKRLKNLIDFIQLNYRGNLRKMQSIDTQELREQLLSVNGVGPETADSILLYAFQKPIFVVDAYTKRVLTRVKITNQQSTYEEVQNIFMSNLSNDTYLFNEYHALIVKLGKDYCKKNNPKCNECPIKDEH